MNNLDYTRAEDLAQPDFFGLGGTITNIEGHKKYFTDQREKLPDTRNNLLEMIAEGNKVVAISMVSGTDVGGYLTPKPTNKNINARICKGEKLDISAKDVNTVSRLMGVDVPVELVIP